jgi:hypothetical protein
MTIPVNDPTLENLQQQNQSKDQHIRKLEQQNAELSAKLQWYEEQFRLAQHRRFGASSEKTSPEQLELNLFNEAEVLASPEPEVETEQIAYERRKQRGKREADLSKLPVETRVYELPTEEQVCTCCGGALHGMSTETRQEIAVVPAQVKVIRHVRQIYACRTCEREGVRLAGCWAHARRGFDEALKALPPSQPKVGTAAQEGLTFCNRLYAVERETKELPAEERAQVRMERSRPILEAFSGWLRQQKGKTLPKSKLGEAIGYGLNQWDKLTLFLEDGRIELEGVTSTPALIAFKQNY